MNSEPLEVDRRQSHGPPICLSKGWETFSSFLLLLYCINSWEILSRLWSHFHVTLMHVSLVVLTNNESCSLSSVLVQRGLCVGRIVLFLQQDQRRLEFPMRSGGGEGKAPFWRWWAQIGGKGWVSGWFPLLGRQHLRPNQKREGALVVRSPVGM